MDSEATLRHEIFLSSPESTVLFFPDPSPSNISESLAGFSRAHFCTSSTLFNGGNTGSRFRA